MANSSPTAAEVQVLASSVQELNLGSENFPEKYICQEGDGEGFHNALVPSQDIPVVDLSLLISPSKAAEEIEKLKSALGSWGCFQAINHGMTSTYPDKVHEVYKQFFLLPKEKKIKYLRELNDTEGYGNDVIFTEDQRLDWNDRLYLTVLPVDQRKFKVWPQNPKDFRPLAKALNLEEDSFWKQYRERGAMFPRLNYYPPCQRPDLALGARPHADGSIVTFVLQDKDVEGLQVLKDNQWLKVPVIPKALVVNVRDPMEIMSNGTFKSPVHRAVINSEKERLSVVMFCDPSEEKVVEPVHKLVNESRPRLYKSVKNYEQTYFQYYQQGKRSIDAVKI